MSFAASQPSTVNAAPRWWCEWELAALALIVVGSYFLRLSEMPVCGEESRWATAAREMIATGDWIAPKQQGSLFPERPPLGSWAIGVVGLVRGEIDLVAVRLPSVCAILFTTLLIYGYMRGWSSRLAAFAGAICFATFGQVLQLGRLGESEAVFTLLVASSLLTWHAVYCRQGPAWIGWCLGYSLAALAALVKGPQAPVYFVATCAGFLLWQREGRRLLTLAHGLGIVCFMAIVGAWLAPFMAAHPTAVDDIFLGLAQDRFTLGGLTKHLVRFPAETFGCLLPWSGLLVVLLKPGVAKSLLRERPQLRFALMALTITYPSVWLAAGARGRYFMPLYPCVAVLIGALIEHCVAQQAPRFEWASWRRYLRIMAVVFVASIGVFVAAQFIDGKLARVRQPVGLVAMWSISALACATALTWSALSRKAPRPQLALAALGAMLGFAYVGPVVNIRLLQANDLTMPIARVREEFPEVENLVSFDRIYHRFAYVYGEPIRQVPWPVAAGEVPDDLTYFCFDRRPSDNDEVRTSGDGRSAWLTPGQLPFAWDVVAEIPCDPEQHRVADRSIVIGRVRREDTARKTEPAETPASPGLLR